MKRELRILIADAVNKVYPEVKEEELAFTVESALNPDHGDYATNVAMQLTKILKKNPREIAQNLANAIQGDIIDKIEIAGPGFVNFFIKDFAFQQWLGKLLKSEDMLKSDVGRNKKVMVEFVSANPTGPLHVGHGRGAAIGDSIAAVLEAAGYTVTREYYINDAGNQMNNLAKSIYFRYLEKYGREYPFPADGYKGAYIADIAEELSKVYSEKLLSMPEEDALAVCKRAGIKSILKNIDETLKGFNVTIDNYFSEESLYKNGEVEKSLKKLEKTGAAYEKDGALWLATEKMGDEKDRVLRKSDGSYTYFTPDIAYHNNKFERGYEVLVDVWGADHHGYIKRMECAIELSGHNPQNFDVVLVQMVSLVKSGEKVMMTTRGGEFIPLDWLVEEVGVDAARFFYNIRSANAQFEFDVDLAKKQTSDNPVYYVQYAHARVCSLMSNAAQKGIKPEIGKNLDLLTLPAERKIIKSLMEFSSIIETAAQYNEPHRVAYYLQELAGDFHSYYYNTVILNEKDTNQTNARLSLCAGVASGIKFGLALLGVSAPERM